tara:strand:+ start:315 stop:1637 length:1323 start_codon:yes stop_codon:yes gene_type:complete
MISLTEKIFTYFFLFIPLFLITGPAAPDIIITLCVIFGIFYFIILKEHRKLLKNNFFLISIIFWLSLILVSFFSYNYFKSFQDSLIFIRFLLVPIFGYFIFFKNNKILIQVLYLILILVIFVCLDTLYQFLNYTSKDGFGEDLLGFKSNWYGRLTGPFGNELIPGSYVSKFGLFGFLILISDKKFKKRVVLHSSYLSLILLVTYISGERMSFATFSLGLILLLIFLKGFRKSIILSIILGFTFIFIMHNQHPFYNDYKVIESSQYHQGLKIEKFFICENESEVICSKIIDTQPSFIDIIKNFNTSAYGEIYLLSLKMFLDNPITGIGINNFKYLCNTNEIYKSLMVNYDCASHPHNIYVQWLVEGGVIVFILFIIYLFFLISLILNNYNDKKYKVISLIIILMMFWPIMSTGSLIKNWYGVTTFFIIALCISLSNFKNNS